MKIISIEGLKGTGKSTLTNILSEKYDIPIMPKFTKNNYKNNYPSIPDWINQMIKQYSKSFINIYSSLALEYYANFFHSLEIYINYTSKNHGAVIFNKGIISLPYHGYYGYRKYYEKLPAKEYWEIVHELHIKSISEYNKLMSGCIDNIFIMLECNEEEIIKRLKSRDFVKPSDTFFLENMNLYQSLSREYENNVRTFIDGTFYRIKNENEKDMERILQKIGENIN